MRGFFIFLFSLLVALPAWGTVSTTWQKTPGGENTSGCAFSARRTSSCFWDAAADNIEPTALNIEMCENVTGSFWDDMFSNTISGNTAKVYVHAAAVIPTINSAALVANKILTGNPAGDLFALYGFDGEYISVELECASSTTTLQGTGFCRIQIQCHPRPQ